MEERRKARRRRRRDRPTAETLRLWLSTVTTAVSAVVVLLRYLSGG